MNSYKKSIMAVLMAFSFVTAPAIYAAPEIATTIQPKVVTGDLALPLLTGVLSGAIYAKCLKGLGLGGIMFSWLICNVVKQDIYASFQEYPDKNPKGTALSNIDTLATLAVFLLYQ